MNQEVYELIHRGIESDTLDYKAAFDWTLASKAQKAKFVRHSIAFANTRGGSIIIGVGEDASGHPSVFQGLTPAQCHSFDPSPIGSYINSHVDPPIDISVERPEVDGKRYAILRIKPFTDVPHVATHSIEDELRTGVFYIRTPSASSRPCTNASEMHDLIRRALRNQRELLGKLLRGILFEGESQGILSGDGAHAPAEYEESVQYFSRRLGKGLSPSTPAWDLAFWPVERKTLNWTLSEVRRAALSALNEPMVLALPFHHDLDDKQSYATNVSLRGMNEQRDQFWQIFADGVIHFRGILPDGFEYPVLETMLHAALAFAGNFYTELGLAEESIHVQFSLCNAQNQPLLGLPGNAAGEPAFCRIGEIVIPDTVSAATLFSARQERAARIAREIAVRFNAPVVPSGNPQSSARA